MDVLEAIDKLTEKNIEKTIGDIEKELAGLVVQEKKLKNYKKRLEAYLVWTKSGSHKEDIEILNRLPSKKVGQAKRAREKIIDNLVPEIAVNALALRIQTYIEAAGPCKLGALAIGLELDQKDIKATLKELMKANIVVKGLDNFYFLYTLKK
jgi:hypothetical protein